MSDIYWNVKNSGFYALEKATKGYILVGHEEHQRLLAGTVATGATIALNENKDGLILVEPEADAE